MAPRCRISYLSKWPMSQCRGLINPSGWLWLNPCCRLSRSETTPTTWRMQRRRYCSRRWRRRRPGGGVAMATDRVFAFGTPENDGERRVIRFLDEHLPEGYRIYHSLELAERGHSYEYDMLVLSPH